MARVTAISPNGELELCRTIKFEKNAQWTKMLGQIPSTVQGTKGEEALDPESEYILQRLLELHPEVLPWEEFPDSPKEEEVRVCVVCNGISSASTDILLVEKTTAGEGRFVVVETKLVKNPEIYRDVLGQILEYAADLSSSETPKSLEEKAESYWRGGRRDDGNDFKQRMSGVFGKDWREEIWNTAVENAQRRNVRLLIVSDSLPEQLRLAVTYLPTSVLMSAVEFQAHGAGSNEGSLTFTGSASASGTAPAANQSALRKYFSNVTLSHATVQRISDSSVVSQVHDRGKTTTPPPVRSYQDHLEKLGEDTAPGQALKMLRKKAQQTGGHVDEGRAYLTPRLFGLPGLNVIEDNAELGVAFWAEAFGVRRDQARKIFCRHFDPKNKKEFDNVTPWWFSFQPIKKDTPQNYIWRLVERLEKLYGELRKLK
jgi:hypothetical protein